MSCYIQGQLPKRVFRITATGGKERNMRRNDQNTPQSTGYPQQNGYSRDGYQGSMPYQGYQNQQSGFQTQPTYAQPQGYPQQFSQPQGYNQAQNYTASRNYQTPQVTGSQPPVSPHEPSSPYVGQGSFSQNAYTQQGYAQPVSGYPGNPYAQANTYQQPSGYQQQSGPTGTTGYGYPGGQIPAGSYIPQTPYSQGYTAGYQANGYAQGFNAYNQMGRSPQMPPNPQQDMGGQVPLNGGGYVPQPVPVRKRPFVMTDAYLLILSALLLVLFALGMFVPGLGILKWVFIVLAAASTVLLWIKPLTANNKRLCYTIVFCLLILVTIIGFVSGGSGDGQSGNAQTNNNPANGSASVQGGSDPYAAAPELTSTPDVTNTPEPNADSEVLERLRTFFYYWSSNRQDDMLTLCSPSWASKEENPKTALFGLMANRTPKNYEEENISGTSNDDSRTVTVTSLMDRNNGKDPVKYRLSIMMDKEDDGLWYVNPKSLQTYENAETPDPSITDTPAPTETPYIDSNTILYYNPSGGEYYHLDQNCKRINERFLPLQGHFSYSELNNEKYSKLKPCAICGAPSRDQ